MNKWLEEFLRLKAEAARGESQNPIDHSALCNSAAPSTEPVEVEHENARSDYSATTPHPLCTTLHPSAAAEEAGSDTAVKRKSDPFVGWRERITDLQSAVDTVAEMNRWLCSW